MSYKIFYILDGRKFYTNLLKSLDKNAFICLYINIILWENKKSKGEGYEQFM